LIAPGDTIRVFIALDIPQDAKDVLAETIRQLRSVIPSGVHWVDPQGIHLTLKFLGNVDSSVVNDLLGAMKMASQNYHGPKFSLSLAGLGLFPNEKQPRVLWAGTDGDIESLRDLQTLVDEATSRLGFSREKRPFRPHLTLGRVQDGVSQGPRRFIGEAVVKTQLSSTPAWEVDTLHLIRSTLTPQGAIYASLGAVPLQAYPHG
jgi:2'-5' RNA ligase